LAFLTGSTFSPSDGIVTPSEGVVGGQQIDTLVIDPNYSKAFRLILTPVAVSTTDRSSTLSPTTPSTSHSFDRPYRPELDKVRSILERELEANLNAQRQQTEARIEAYKSQQLIALERSIESTRKEKDCLWSRIQERITSPPAPTSSTSGTGEYGNYRPSADVNGGQHPFDMVPSTLPVRFTNASRLDPYGSFIDKRRAGETDAAMSLQFREFDQRMASNSMRRQSLVHAHAATEAAAAAAAAAAASSTADDTEEVTHINTVANATPAIVEERSSSPSAPNSGTSTPTERSKKKVTISDAIKRVSIVEPENNDADVEGKFLACISVN
jgi:hypothetical protein